MVSCFIKALAIVKVYLLCSLNGVNMSCVDSPSNGHSAGWAPAGPRATCSSAQLSPTLSALPTGALLQQWHVPCCGDSLILCPACCLPRGVLFLQAISEGLSQDAWLHKEKRFKSSPTVGMYNEVITQLPWELLGGHTVPLMQ